MNNLNTFELSLSDTRVIKGVAILLMLIHHFFGFPHWLVNGNYFYAIPIGEFSLEFYLANFSKICVSIFLFLTGYGCYYSYKKIHAYRDSIKKLVLFLINYWLILCLIFIPLQFLNHSFEFSLKSFVLNLIGLRSDYIYFAWYVRLHIAIVLSFPLLRKLVTKGLFNSIVYAIFIPLFIRVILSFAMSHNSELSTNTFLVSLREFLVYLPYLLNGYIFSSYNLFTQMKSKIPKMFDKWYFFLSIILFSIIARNYFPTLLDLVYVPLLIFSVISLIRQYHLQQVSNILSILGENSTNLWFLHAIFFGKTAYLQWIAYFPKFPIFIVLWVVIILVPFSIIINKILMSIQNSKFILNGINGLKNEEVI